MRRVTIVLMVCVLMMTLSGCALLDDPDAVRNTEKGMLGDLAAKFTGGSLYDIEDSDIRAFGGNGHTLLEGEEAAAMIAHIPPEIKKAVGNIKPNQCNIRVNTSDGGYDFNMTLELFDESNYQALVRYYKTLDGHVTHETSAGSMKIFTMTFAWGELYQCEMSPGELGQTLVRIGFHIYE